MNIPRITSNQIMSIGCRLVITQNGTKLFNYQSANFILHYNGDNETNQDSRIDLIKITDKNGTVIFEGEPKNIEDLMRILDLNVRYEAEIEAGVYKESDPSESLSHS